MKIKQVIQVIALLVVVVVLYCFAINRHEARSVVKTEIEFSNGEHLFLTKESVNNLLIVNAKKDSFPQLDSLDLNKIEYNLRQNPLIADVQVYKTVDKSLGIRVTQREPIARVLGKESFYIDKNGHKMPLSTHYTARVPFVSGIKDSAEIAEVFPLLQKIKEDDFLKHYVTAVEKEKSGDYILKLRQKSTLIIFGKISEINTKINNLKAFFKKAHQDQIFDQYSHINLKYTNQVIGTKKEA